MIEEPRAFTGNMPIRGLPDFACPFVAVALPAEFERREQAELPPRFRLGRVFEHAAIATHGVECSGKAPAIVGRTILFAAIAREVEVREVCPQMARWMRDDREIARIIACIAIRPPDVDVGAIGIDAIWIDEQRRDHPML